MIAVFQRRWQTEKYCVEGCRFMSYSHIVNMCIYWPKRKNLNSSLYGIFTQSNSFNHISWMIAAALMVIFTKKKIDWCICKQATWMCIVTQVDKITLAGSCAVDLCSSSSSPSAAALPDWTADPPWLQLPFSDRSYWISWANVQFLPSCRRWPRRDAKGAHGRLAGWVNGISGEK